MKKTVEEMVDEIKAAAENLLSHVTGTSSNSESGEQESSENDSLNMQNIEQATQEARAINEVRPVEERFEKEDTLIEGVAPMPYNPEYDPGA